MELTPFDLMIHTPFLQMSKLLIPYLPPKNQRTLAIYIKFMEFQNTISSFHAFKNNAFNTQDVLNEIRPYLPSDMFDSIDNLMNMMSMMELFQNMSETADLDPMEMVQNMFSTEQGGE
jgi:hypothetical protein